MPAGHVDGDATFEIAAVRELKEETGLEAGTLELLIEERQENMCRRPAGSWHLWRVYSATVGGELKRSEEETKSAAFYTPAEIKCLAKMTEDYRAGKISEEQWQRQPGLEPIMYDWFKKLELI